MFDDNYDTPSMGGNYDSYDNAGTRKKDFKKVLPFAIIGIVLLIIAVFVFMFFASQKTIDINIKELGGGTVSNATLTIRSPAGIVYGPATGTNHKVTLGIGEYTYSVISPEHNQVRNIPLTVSAETTEKPITLEKNIIASMRVSEKIEKIYDGQTLKGSLIIDNIQTELQNQEIIITDSEKLLKITLTQTKITVSDMKPVIIDFDLTVADKTLKKAKDTKITFTLKGTTISSTFTITVHPTIPLTEFIESARETNKTILDETLKAGELKPIILTFQNKNKNITAENLLFEIVADEGYEDKLSWISMTNDNIINKIEPTKKETIQLRVTPPITSQIGDDFKGKLIIKSDSLEDKKEYIISFKVKTASNVNLVFNKNTFKTKCTSECITINTATEGMKLKNAGNADATDVKIELDPTRSNECDTDWIVELLVNSFDVISAGKDKTIEMAITPRYINNTKKTTCYFKISYTDPTKEDRQVILVDPPLIIETTYSEK